MVAFKGRIFLCSLLHLMFCCRFVLSQLSLSQRTSMNALSEKLNITALQWNPNTEPCSWKGVKCSSRNASVLQISLSGHSISSSPFLPVVCEIDSLQAFDASNNMLSEIPEEFMRGCGRLDGLRLLNFSGNRFVGSLPNFVGFAGLEFLDFSFNSFGGIVGLEFEGLDNLKSLNLSFNKFTGRVPANLGKSMALKEFVISTNHFTGTIPEELMGYKNLTHMDLSGNNLTGSIPARIAALSKLEILILSLNNLDGEIPDGLSGIATLSRFAANQNRFPGNVPSGITRFLRNLDLSYCNLIGSIPSDLLSGSNLQTLDLSFNSLEGRIPGSISRSLIRLRLGSNSLDGPIPSTEWSALERLTYLELDNNNLTGLVPSELGLCRNLALLNLGQNRLTGPVPPGLGNLSHLQVLKLQINGLSGEIPLQITQLTKLAVLNISWNSLTGQIPPSISRLKDLVNLNLGGNRLSGSIPDTIYSLKNLLELQLGENRLSDNIPTMPLNLQIGLNLSHNRFAGPIPRALAELGSLEILDLSNNNFSGKIPEFLANLPALQWLLLSNNSLSGVIPKFRSWAVIDTQGNTGLVSPPPDSKPEHFTGPSKRNLTVIIALTVAFSAVAVIAVAVLVVLLSRRYGKVNDEQSPPPEALPRGTLLTSNALHRSSIDFAKAMESVSVPSNAVLKTRFSTYYRVTMPSGSTYLVKKLNWSDRIFQHGSHARVGAELERFARLSNSNVMTPLAFAVSAESAFVFYEYPAKGSLSDALHGGAYVEWASRHSMAVGVAQGMAFLHGGGILLVDLSSESVFLKSAKEAQIGEVELYKLIDPAKSTGSISTVAGSVGYIPPEYAYTMRVTAAGNVYSFGVILLELLTGKPAVSDGTELAKWVSANTAQQDRWDTLLDPSIRRASPATASQMLSVMKIAVACVAASPESRPKMKSVLRMLLNAR